MTKSLFNLENISELSDLSPSLTCLPLSPVSLSHLSVFQCLGGEVLRRLSGVDL